MGSLNVAPPGIDWNKSFANNLWKSSTLDTSQSPIWIARRNVRETSVVLNCGSTAYTTHCATIVGTGLASRDICAILAKIILDCSPELRICSERKRRRQRWLRRQCRLQRGRQCRHCLAETVSTHLATIRAFAASNHRRKDWATWRHGARVDTCSFVPGCVIVGVVHIQPSCWGGRDCRRGLKLAQTDTRHLDKRNDKVVSY